MATEDAHQVMSEGTSTGGNILYSLVMGGAEAANVFYQAIVATDSDAAIAYAYTHASNDNLDELPTPLPSPPNPNGRKGGIAHQTEVAEVVRDVKSRGFNARTEYYVSTPYGTETGRFVDVAALDVNRVPVEFHQIGRQTKSGLPVVRERIAIDDIFNASGIQPIFHPYNK